MNEALNFARAGRSDRRFEGVEELGGSLKPFGSHSFQSLRKHVVEGRGTPGVTFEGGSMGANRMSSSTTEPSLPEVKRRAPVSAS